MKCTFTKWPTSTSYGANSWTHTYTHTLTPSNPHKKVWCTTGVDTNEHKVEPRVPLTATSPVFNFFSNSMIRGQTYSTAGHKRVENQKEHSNFSNTHTASYQRLPNRTYIKMIAIHRYMYWPPKWVVAITLSYSPLSMLYPQVIYTQ